MKRVIIETPYAGNILQRWLNRRYARQCMRDSLLRGEAPFASHLLYTQMLRDNIPSERSMGINAGFAWRSVADATIVYTDRGISTGMKIGIAHAKNIHVVEYRTLRK